MISHQKHNLENPLEYIRKLQRWVDKGLGFITLLSFLD